MLERDRRSITLLDGDEVRRYLSSELGFSKRDRDTNVLRIGYFASEIARAGGIAICAPIAPNDEARKHARSLVADDSLLLVHVATPLELCEARDRTGFYARARAGQLASFTGIDDPYERPDEAVLEIDTSRTSVDSAVSTIISALIVREILSASDTTPL